MSIHSQGGGLKGDGSCGQNTDGDLHIINQLRKIVDMEMPMLVKFLDHTYVRVDFRTAKLILEKYNSLRTSIQKEQLTNALWASPDYITTNY
jgi:hypothetical protein